MFISNIFKLSMRSTIFVIISLLMMLTSCSDSLFPVTKQRTNVSNKVKLKFYKTNISPYFTLEKLDYDQYRLKICIPVAKNQIPEIDTSTKLTMLVNKEDIFYFYSLFIPKLVEYDINSDVDTCLYEIQYSLNKESIKALMTAKYLELQIDQNKFLYGKAKGLRSLRKFLATVYF